MRVKEAYPSSNAILWRLIILSIMTSYPCLLRVGAVGHPQKPSLQRTKTGSELVAPDLLLGAIFTIKGKRVDATLGF